MDNRSVVRPSQKIAVYLIEGISISRYTIIFVAFVCIAAMFYYFLIPAGHGIAGNEGSVMLSYWDALYFSLVTVSSLGYGDIHPVGLSRAVACAEVLFGLFIMGIIIAKATSFRLSYHVQRLFSSSIHDRMLGFAQEFEKIHTDLQTISKTISESFDVPGKKKTRAQNSIAKKFAVVAELLQSHSSGIAEYVAIEIDYGYFFSLAPPRTMQMTATSIEKAIYTLGTTIQYMGPSAKQALLNSDNRSRINRAIGRLDTLHEFVESHCTIPDVSESFMKLRKTCQGMPSQYFAVPEVPSPLPNLQPPSDESESDPQAETASPASPKIQQP